MPLPGSPTLGFSTLTTSAPIQANGAQTPMGLDGTVIPAVDEPHVQVADDVHQRAEKVREELGLATRAAGGMTLEQRLEHYRVRSRARAQNLAANQVAPVLGSASSEPTAQAAAAAPAPVAPQAPVPQPAAVLTTPMPTAEQVANVVLGQHGPAITGKIEEMMRPLVRDWLTNNLPTIVERLVRDEIERVSKGRTTK